MKHDFDKDWEHDELAADLAEHLEDEARVMWLDMQMGPSGSPRPDVYTMQKSFTKSDPRSYEIKVSYADFRHDVTEGKWQKYLDFSCCVIFATPRGLVSVDDIPKGCGFMERGPNGWRTVRKPTLQRFEMKKNHYLKLIMTGIQEEFSNTQHLRISAQKRAEEYLSQYSEDVKLAVYSLTDARDELFNIEDELSYHRIKNKGEINSKLLAADREIHYRKEASATLWTEICALCDIKEPAGAHNVNYAFKRLKEQILVEPALQRTRDLLDLIQSQLDNAKKALK